MKQTAVDMRLSNRREVGTPAKSTVDTHQMANKEVTEERRKSKAKQSEHGNALSSSSSALTSTSTKLLCQSPLT